MTLYKINIDNRNYGSWTVFNATTLEPITLEGFNPAEHKLFTNDVFTYNKGKVDIVHSSTRINENIPAVLILADNKTYGRQYRLEAGQTYTRKRAELAGGKLLYKCIPDDVRIPIFLVPYEIKQMGFSKVFNNLYVTIRYKQWDDKHPHATLSQTIGPVDVLDNFYEYQLYCKSLNASIQKFQKDTNKSIDNRSHEGIIDIIKSKFPNLEDRTDQSFWHIITIDPLNSADYDDGFSVIDLDDNKKQLSVYISNVTIWMDVLNLWDSFSRRISTIYLPDKKRPMLPTILSDCLCSLQQNVRRVAFVMDVIIKDNTILDIKFCNAIIKVSNNYVYEESKLLSDKKYHDIELPLR